MEDYELMPDGRYRKRRKVDSTGKTPYAYYLRLFCSVCNKPIFVLVVNYKRNKTGKFYCDNKLCRYALQRGVSSWNWSGGRKFKRGSKGGHILIHAPRHPYAKKGYYPEHRLVVEYSLGRYLRPDELVHHIDCDPQNNNLTNLVVVSIKQHFLAHGSLNKCVKELMNGGKLIFDLNKLEYKVEKV